MRNHRWKLQLPFAEAIERNEVVSLADSAILRYIDKLNHQPDTAAEIIWINSRIRELQKQEPTPELKAKIKKLQQDRTHLQLKLDYMELVIDRRSDFKKAVKDGFKINGIEYSFLLGTTSGLKNNTVIFCSSRLKPQLVEFLNCGRNLEKEIVPAKFCAYAALACSASVPVSSPRGIIVVPDCFTDFKENVITIDNSKSDEPVMTPVQDYEIHKDCSDGFGTITPECAARWSEELGLDYTFSGCNTRYAFEKGMLVVFDHIAFAEEVFGASAYNQDAYFIRDVWGNLQDIRNAEVILTESMLKLWDSYSSIDDYLENCEKYGYTMSVTKVTPGRLENDWTLNYQFTQSYSLTDSELEALVQPTIEEIGGLLGGDYRKMLLYFFGTHITDDTFRFSPNDCRKALMICPDMIRDPAVNRMILEMTDRRINDAKISKLNVHGNYQIACGDPYALWQSILGLEVTGLLAAGEIYSNYWRQEGVEKVTLFRAPMTNHSSIRTAEVSYSHDAAKWYEYIDTMMVINPWDTIDAALNGMDYDGDMVFSTDNEVLLKNTKNPPTLICLQDKAAKKKITEQEIIQSCLDGFGSKIGLITNRITAQFDVQGDFAPDELEYEVLQHRIESGQKNQQDEIDSLKGIISRPAPPYWFNRRDNYVNDDDNVATRHHKLFNREIVADKRPYFMIYRYSRLKSTYKKFYNDVRINVATMLHKDLDDILTAENPSEDEQQIIDSFLRKSNVSIGSCVPNRICKLLESEFDALRKNFRKISTDFDNSIYKTNKPYSRKTYLALKKIYEVYTGRMKLFVEQGLSSDYEDVLTQYFKDQCDLICPDEETQCDCLVDFAYTNKNSKVSLWNLCGGQIIKNLLDKSNHEISYPVETDSEFGEFVYNGRNYSMVTSRIDTGEEVE